MYTGNSISIRQSVIMRNEIIFTLCSTASFIRIFFPFSWQTNPYFHLSWCYMFHYVLTELFFLRFVLLFDLCSRCSPLARSSFSILEYSSIQYSPISKRALLLENSQTLFICAFVTATSRCSLLYW